MTKPEMFCLLFIRLYDLKQDVYLLPVPFNSHSDDWVSPCEVLGRDSGT